MKIFHQGLILVAVPLAIELVIVFTLIMHIHASQEAISELQKFTQLTRLMTATNGKIQEAFFQAGFMAIDKSEPSYEDALRVKVFDVEKSVMQIKKAFDEDARLSKYQTKVRLGTIDESIDRLIRLINDLLDVEKFEAGQMQLSLEEASCNQLISSAFEAVSGMAEAQKVELLVVSNDRPLMVDGDRIVQVLVNLLSNAIKFSPSHSEVEVRAFERDGMAEFRVIDHGRGIPKDKLDSVFERFKQVDAKNAVEKKGSGLGLAICKNIIEAHGGTIGVDSIEGEGSQFWFRLKMIRVV